MADEAKGKGKHLGGRIKESIGDMLGDRKMRKEGRAQQVEGEAEQDMSRAQKDAEEAAARKARAEEAQRDT